VVLVVSAVLDITWLGLPLLIGAAAVLRGCAAVERGRARIVSVVIPAAYRPVPGTGVFTHLRARWHDPATWRDCAYLLGLFPALLVLDVVGLAIWLGCLAGITVPIWYWSLTDPWGIGPVSLPTALLTAVVAIVASLFTCYLVVAVARVHRALARLVLGPYVDPLADAKRILAGPGPLSTD
jgi:Putative sensor